MFYIYDLLEELPTGGGAATPPFVYQQFDWLGSFQESGFWSSRSQPRPIVLDLVGGNFPFVNKRWAFNNDDAPTWLIEPLPRPKVLDLVGGNFPFVNKRWAYNNDDAPTWLIEPLPIPPVQRVAVSNPFAPSRWKYDNDDAAVWYTKPGAIAKVQLPEGGNFPFKADWKVRYTQDDAAHWLIEPIPVPPVSKLVGGGFPFKPQFWKYDVDWPGTWNGGPSNVSIIQQLVLASPLLPKKWLFDIDEPSVWWGGPQNVSVNITQPGPPVPARPKGVGWVGRKRWWEELQEEYLERYKRENPSRAKKAVVARQQVKKIADEAVSLGLLDNIAEPAAAQIAELVVKTQYAPRLEQTLDYARQVREVIDRLYDEDEDDVLILAMALN